MVSLSLPAVVTGLSAVLTLYFLRRVWPYRDRPGGRLFVVLVGAMVLWAATYAVALTVFDPFYRRLLEGPLWLAVNGVGFTFFAFALAYTGRNYLLRSLPVVGVGLALVASTLVVATAPVHDLVQTNYAVDPVYGAATVTYDRGAWFYLTVGLDYLLVTVGVLLLVDTVVSYGQDYRRQAVAIALSPLPVVLASLPWLFRIGPGWQLNLTAVAFPFHLALDMYALFQARMFVLTPGVRRAGERAAVDDLGTAVILVDDADRVVTLNDEAERVLDVTAEEALATPVSDLVETEFGLDDETLAIRTAGMKRRYAVTASPFTDATGTPIGRTVVLQDVTQERRREQRLTVLNRVLRHNLRNDLTVVRGHAELVAGQLEDPDLRDHVETVLDEIEGLVTLGEKARTFETIAGEETHTEVAPLYPLLSDVVADARGDYPDATLSVDVPEDATVETNVELLRLAVGELVENALEHGGPGAEVVVSLATDSSSESVVLTVTDDGPGIPDHEVAVLGDDAETDLEHASGIGLWLVQWSVDALGGDASFETDEGTTARLRLPDADGETETRAD